MEFRQNRLSSQMSLDEDALIRMSRLSSLQESESMKNFSVRDEDFKKDKSTKTKKEIEKEKKEAKKAAKEAAKAAKDEKKDKSESMKKQS